MARSLFSDCLAGCGKNRYCYGSCSGSLECGVPSSANRPSQDLLLVPWEPFSTVRAHLSPDLCGENRQRQQFPHPHEVIGGSREGENPSDFEDAPVSQLAQEGDGLEPAEAFLDPLALLLTDAIPGVPRRAPINRAASRPAGVLGDVRRYVHRAAFPDKIPSVVALVARYRSALVTAPASDHSQSRLALCRSVGFQHFTVGNQPVAILDQQVAAVAQFGFLAAAFTRQPRIRIGRGFVRFVGPAFAVKSTVGLPGSSGSLGRPLSLF